jgi:hypothetical protein
MASWLSALSLVLIGIAPNCPRDGAGVVRQRVDLVELNHFVDDDGREVFRQVIFYDWSKTHHRFHVRAWRLIKNDSQIPVRRWNPPRYQCTWHDDGLLRQVWTPQLRETWTQQDPERVNRGLLPEDQRIPLHVPKLAANDEPR